MKNKFQKWEEFEKELNITKEQENTIELEMELIRENIQRNRIA